MRVLPDVAAIDKEFDYLVPEAFGDQVRVGTIVRISLHGRRVGGWVVADRVEPVAGMALRPLAKVTGWGPSPEVIDVAGWAARRWAGRRSTLLKTASPDHAVLDLPVLRPGPRAEPAEGAQVPGPTVDSTAAGSGGPPMHDLATSGGEIGLPPTVVALSAAAPRRGVGAGGRSEEDQLAHDALAMGSGRAVLRLPPALDVLPVVVAALRWGPTLVVTPSATMAGTLAGRLGAQGITVAVVPRGWGDAAAGASVVIGARAAAWAPCPNLAAVVVIDGHEEGLQQEQAPTWNAWEVAAERARRRRVPCVVVSSCPTLDLLAWPRAALVAPSRATERAGWAALEVIDTRRNDPHTGLYSPRLVGLLRGGGRVLCVLNRKGRARLLACSACRELARCECCGAAVALVGAADAAGKPRVALAGSPRPAEHATGRDSSGSAGPWFGRGPSGSAAATARSATNGSGEPAAGGADAVPGAASSRDGLDRLWCPRCGTVRPVVCVACGSARLKLIRVGVSRAREELEALAGRPVGLVTAETGAFPEAEILVGTEAVLRRPYEADGVAFLDFDQELLAPRYRAAEEALALLACASRLVGGRRRRGRVLVQTRVPQNEVLAAALAADPGRLAASELSVREALRLPPATAVAVVSGPVAEQFVRSLTGVEVLGPDRGGWLVRATDHEALSAALAAVRRPPGRLRIAVDLLRL